MIQSADGNFYGTTAKGGANNEGTVFMLTPPPLQFVPVMPCRLVDTRTQNGGGGPIQGGTFEVFNLPQLAKQGTNCPTLDLSSASAYSLNVTVVPHEPLG